MLCPKKHRNRFHRLTFSFAYMIAPFMRDVKSPPSTASAQRMAGPGVSGRFPFNQWLSVEDRSKR